MTEKVQIITADQIPDILEQVLTLRNPELAKQRRRTHRQELERYRKTGSAAPKSKPIVVKDLADLAIARMSILLGETKTTPSIAGKGIISERRYTSRNAITDLNRDLSPVRVKRYLQAMLENKWMLTSDAIAITADGLVINGQHRLAAGLHYIEKLNEKYTIEDIKKAREQLPRFLILWRGGDRSTESMGRRDDPPNSRDISGRDRPPTIGASW